MDILTVAAGDIVDLAGALTDAANYDTLTAIVEDTNISNTVTAANVQLQRGVYVAGTTNTFTSADASGGANAVMISADKEHGGTAAEFSMILSGVTGLTSMTNGVITV